jgi:hypothetical protein
MQRKESQRTPRTTSRRMFSSNLNTPGISFGSALVGKIDTQQQPRTHQVAVPDTMEHRVPTS